MGSFLEALSKCPQVELMNDFKEFAKHISIAHTLGEKLADFLQNDEKDEYMASHSLVGRDIRHFGSCLYIEFVGLEMNKIPKFFLDMYKENFTGFKQRSSRDKITKNKHIPLQLMIDEFNKTVKNKLNMDVFENPSMTLELILVEFEKVPYNQDMLSITIELYNYIP